MSKEISILKSKIDDVRCFLRSLKKEENYNLEEIRSRLFEIFSLTGGYKKPYFYHTFISEGLYRARKHSSSEYLFEWTNDFLYRDWINEPSVNWRYDRLNLPGESVWYFSNNIHACIAEIKPEKDDIISVANIKQFTSIRFNHFLHLGSAFLRAGDSNLDKMHTDEEISRNLSEIENQELKLIDDFFDEVFLTQVSDEEKFKYIPTVALAQIFKNSKVGINTDGIVYPSVAFELGAVNVALLNPKLDKTNFYLYQTIQFIVTKTEKDKYYEVEPLLVGKNLNENQYGNFPIYWKKPSPEEIKAYSYRIEINTTSCTS